MKGIKKVVEGEPNLLPTFLQKGHNINCCLWRIERYIGGKQAGFYGKSRTLSHLVAFEEYMADKVGHSYNLSSCERYKSSGHNAR